MHTKQTSSVSYSEPRQILKMECFAKTVDGWMSLTISAEYVLDLNFIEVILMFGSFVSNIEPFRF